jgi:hypothetical protein
LKTIETIIITTRNNSVRGLIFLQLVILFFAFAACDMGSKITSASEVKRNTIIDSTTTTINAKISSVPVDTHGRALDTDGDGVPDYLDKELLTQQKCFL